jgi:protocatechuate 3,4-dioxygenase alpha subunit
LFDKDTAGERIRIVGQVLDGEGTPINDALIEIWQADSRGHYATAGDARNAGNSFKGFGRCGTGTDSENRFFFETIKPGAVNSQQAPHVNVIVLMRGMLSHAFTRMYFPEEPAANAKDAVLNSVPASRRATLIAARETTPEGVVYRFNIHMQGDQETVFFDG